jgi:hypothetical protein
MKNIYKKIILYLLISTILIVLSQYGIPYWDKKEESMGIINFTYINTTNKTSILPDVDYKNTEIVIHTNGKVINIKRKQLLGNICIEYTIQ